MANPIQQAFLQVPLITRTFATACCLTTLACVSALGPEGRKRRKNADFDGVDDVSLRLAPLLFAQLIACSSWAALPPRFAFDHPPSRGTCILLRKHLMRIALQQLELVTPYQLYFNLDLVLTRGEVGLAEQSRHPT